MTDRLNWARDGQDWPNRGASRFIRADGFLWHVQEFGGGPVALLLHGTAAATHSWRTLAPGLAKHFRVFAMDLPGHGFTESPGKERLSLAGMAQSVDALVHELGIAPRVVVGHSAGCAIAVTAILNHQDIRPDLVIGLNAALLPFGGLAGQMFQPLARLLAMSPLMPRLFTWRAGNRMTVDRVLRNTGSTIDADGLEFYARLFCNPGHVEAALAMMAQWDLDSLQDQWAGFKTPLHLIACGGDLAVPSDDAFRVRDRYAGVSIEYVRNLGHLAHEEKPQEFAKLIVAACAGHGIPNAGESALVESQRQGTAPR